MAKKQKIVVVGGGFGGIKAALELVKHDQFDVTLVSDRDHFEYHPKLYHVAVGGDPTAAMIPLSEIIDDKPIKFVKGTATGIDRKAKKLKLKNKSLPYDQLILALGVVTNYFGIKGLDKYSYGIKSLADAREFRDHLHKLLIEEQKPDVNYVVIGGGPTGVELAGSLPHYVRHVMKSHGIKERPVHVDLVEAAPRLLPAMPKGYSKAVTKHLRKIGVQIFTNQKVEAESADMLTVSGHDIASHSVCWTAGVTNNPFFKGADFKLSDRGKVLVNDYLQSEPDIYVIGDNAETKYSGMAQTALRDAHFVVNNLVRMSRGSIPFKYRPLEPAYITPAGSKWAAVLWGQFMAFGFIGRLLRSWADLIAYHDLEPWWKARQHWVAGDNDAASCPVCAGKS